MKTISINTRKSNAVKILKSATNPRFKVAYNNENDQILTNSYIAIYLKDSMKLENIPVAVNSETFNMLDRIMKCNFTYTYILTVSEIMDLISKCYNQDKQKTIVLSFSENNIKYCISADFLEKTILTISNSFDDKIKLYFQECNTRMMKLENISNNKASAVICPISSSDLEPYYFFNDTTLSESEKTSCLNFYNQRKLKEKIDETLTAVRSLFKAVLNHQYEKIESLLNKSTALINSLNLNDESLNDTIEKIKDIENRINTELKTFNMKEIKLLNSSESMKEETKQETTAETTKNEIKEENKTTETTKEIKPVENQEIAVENKPTEKQYNFYLDLCKKYHIEKEENLTKKSISLRIGLIKKYGFKAKNYISEIAKRENSGKNTAVDSQEVTHEISHDEIKPTENKTITATESDQEERLYNSILNLRNINVTYLDKPKYIEGVTSCRVSKVNDFEDAINYILDDAKKYPESIEVAKIEKIINFNDFDNFNYFITHLMQDYGSLFRNKDNQEMGGYYFSKNNNFDEMIDNEEVKKNLYFSNETGVTLARKGIYHITKCIEIRLENKPVFLIDPEGYNYCRYVVALPTADYIPFKERDDNHISLKEEEKKELESLIRDFNKDYMTYIDCLFDTRERSPEFMRALTLNGIQLTRTKYGTRFEKIA